MEMSFLRVFPERLHHTTGGKNMARFADEYISVPVEVYDDLITNQLRIDLLRHVVVDELKGNEYQVLGMDATKTIKMIIGIRKEERNDNPYVD